MLEGLVNNQLVLDDGNLNKSYVQENDYEPRLVIVDTNQKQELSGKPGMEEIILSEYTHFITGKFQGLSERLFAEHGYFDFVWFDCGGVLEYENFLSEYLPICVNYLIFHWTYTNGKPNENHRMISSFTQESFISFDIVEPHKNQQSGVTILQRKT